MNGRIKQSLFKWLARAFCRRNIIIISDHKTGHYPLSGMLQLCLLVMFSAGVGWISYSSGTYVESQRQLVEKQKKLENAAMETQKVESEFALLKRDLATLINKENDLSDYTKFVIEQYQEGGDPAADIVEPTSLDHTMVFDRITFLESTIEELKRDQQDMVELVEITTQGKINELQDAIAMTGVEVKEIATKAKKKREKEKLAKNDGTSNPQGGPYAPINSAVVDRNPQLYDNLKRMMLLHDVITMMPTSSPMKNARTTSGFGMRVDPFRKRIARHNGLDFAGHISTAPIYAPSDGKVVYAKRMGSYGLTVDIDHGLGIKTRYGHLSKIDVEVGQRLTEGDKIGNQGSTGRSTGPHLHYEVHYNGTPLNPEYFLKAGKHVQQQEN